MPENVLNLGHKVQDAWYWMLFVTPFLMGSMIDAGKKMAETKGTFTWNVGIIVTLIVLTFGAFQRFILVEKDMKELQKRDAEQTQILIDREKYISVTASNEARIEGLMKEAEEDKAFHMRRLAAAVSDAQGDYVRLEEHSATRAATLRAELKPMIDRLVYRQDDLWEAKNKGGRFTSEDGKEHKKIMKANSEMIAKTMALNTETNNTLNARLTRLFEKMDILDDRLDDRPRPPFIWDQTKGATNE